MTSEKEPGHRWSGWPGAWCLDCGCDDPYEIALADGLIEFDENDNMWFPNSANEARCRAALVCPEPGSKRHDPYAARAAKTNGDSHE